MTSSTPPVVLDVMGGDAAPDVGIEAAGELHRLGTSVLLCGDPEVVGPDGLHAADVVGMDEEPAFAVHQRRDVSIRVAARAVADGRASAVVSAGSTGATVAAALLELGRQPGIRRPVIAARVPTEVGYALLLDVGAVPDADASVLVSAAALGLAHVRRDGAVRPTVGLLNVGTEAGKGDALRREVAARLAQVEGFVGNVEPRDLLSGAADVVVTDGFTGNLVLKTIEAMMPAAGSSPAAPRDGAAVLLGVAGTVLVAHGAATAADLVDAVQRAGVLAARAGLPDIVMDEVGRVTPAPDIDRLVREQLQLVLALDDLPSADARLAEDLHADSLDLVEAVEGVERALAGRGITALLRDDVLRTISTVRDAVDAVRQAIAADTTASTAGQGGSSST